MKTFRSIEELIKVLGREKTLLREMFAKRKSFSFKTDYARELVDYKEERIRFLIDYGIIHESGNYLEMEDVYLQFFEEVLEVNEQINTASVAEYITTLNENIEYYLKENNERRRMDYHKKVRKTLKNIALTTVRNVIDLKRNVDNTYKNEPNYLVKRARLIHLDEKRDTIATLIKEVEKVIDVGQPVFFAHAMDVQLRSVVTDVKLQLNEVYHNLLEIDRQIIGYLNFIDYQNKLFKKIQQIKYLKDQLTWEEHTNVKMVMGQTNPVWIEPQAGYRLKLSINYLRNEDGAIELLQNVMQRIKLPNKAQQTAAEAIDAAYIQQQEERISVVSQQEMMNAFRAQGSHLFAFVMNHAYKRELNLEEKLVLFCQIATQYESELRFTSQTETTQNIEYPLIYPAK